MAALVLFLAVLGFTTKHGEAVDPEVYMNATQLITSKGYPCENHYVTTADGFILNMQRIPHGVKGSVGERLRADKPVVMLQHGLLGSASNFLDNLANESLAYILADAGADVWLGNVRGNMYSHAHKTLYPNDTKFWNWSFDEMARYDLPAMIDHVVETSGQPQIYYVGHSQGTMIGFAGFSQNKTLGHLVKTFIALAPVARVGHVKGAFTELARIAKTVEPFLELFGHGEFLPTPNAKTSLAEKYCNEDPFVCENIIFLLGGFNFDAMNQTRVPVYVAHNPAGTSVQNIMHFAQGVNHDTFNMFDYGSASANQQHYNQDTPPTYHPENMETPVVLFRGGHDWLADPDDVTWLKSQLKSLVADHPIPSWEHMDFIWAVNAPQMCYNEIVNIVMSK